jgi:endoglucanase
MRCVYVLVAGVAALAGCAADSPYTSSNLASYPRSDVAVAAVSASTITRDGFAKLGPGVNYIAFAKQGEGVHGRLESNGDSDLMWRAGFRHVRLPVHWSAHANRTASAQIDAAFLARVDAAVTRLLDQGFTVVITMMDYPQLDGERPGWVEPSVKIGVIDLRFLAMWQQIAAHFAGRSDRVWFELYNEPHGRMTAAAWNDLSSRALRVVRHATTSLMA